ncbi:MAG: hypothetical protein WD690_14535 [Vicinamibacterales bacterium]
MVRNYAKINRPFSADAWFDAFRRGRVYVTNGPFLEADPPNPRYIITVHGDGHSLTFDDADA